jgi:putative ABC transport system permease protein
MVLLLLALVRDDLLREWRASLPADAPNYFLINIRPDEGAAVRAFFAARGLPPTELVPLVRARLLRDQRPSGRQDRVRIGRGERVSRARGEPDLVEPLRDDNRIVEGAWWREGDGGGRRISLEREFANTCRSKLGDELTFDVAART